MRLAESWSCASGAGRGRTAALGGRGVDVRRRDLRQRGEQWCGLRRQQRVSRRIVWRGIRGRVLGQRPIRSVLRSVGDIQELHE